MRPAGDGELALGARAEFEPDRLLELLDHRRLGLAHAGDAQRDVGLVWLAELRQHARGQRRWEVREDQGDRLVRLAAEDRGDPLRGDPAQELERARLGRPGDAPEQLDGPLGSERLLDHVPGEVDAAVGRAAGEAGGGHLVEDGVGRLGADPAEACHLGREALDLVLAHPADHFRGTLGAERGHQDGRLARPVDGLFDLARLCACSQRRTDPCGNCVAIAG